MQDVTDLEVRRNIGENLVRLRGERSIYEIAKALDLHTIHLSRIERAIHAPSVGLLARIAEFYGVSVDSLVAAPVAKKTSRRAAQSA